jgi:hypothetical protein
VERLMRKHCIVEVHKPAKVRTTIPAEDNPPMPDLIGRRFDPGEPDVAWVGDITYIATGEGWLYLASVLDLGSRRWLGYSMADHMRTELVSDALDMAVATRGGHVNGVIFHGDRGSQYMSGDYRRQVVDDGMVQSVGRTGVRLGQQCGGISVVIAETRARVSLPVQHSSRSPKGDLSLDQPLQLTPPTLHPRLHRPHHLGAAILSTQGQPGRVTNVTGKRGDAHSDGGSDVPPVW